MEILFKIPSLLSITSEHILGEGKHVIMTSTFLFLILILLFRPMIIGLVPKNLNIIVMTLLFFVWFSLSQSITNALSYNKVKNKLIIN